jgi:hypothetical protein
MIRKLLNTTVTLAAATGMALAFAGCAEAAAAPSHGALTPAVGCTSTSAAPIELNSFAFVPAEVAPGGQSAAILVTTNCTNVSVSTTQTWLGQWLSASGTGIPSGCPVIDPLARSAVYSPGQERVDDTEYTVPSGCTANALKVTVRVASGGTTILTATATLLIS